MVAVSPALAKEDLSTVELLQFAFGKPNNLTAHHLRTAGRSGHRMLVVHRTRCGHITMDLQSRGRRNGSQDFLGLVSGGFRSGIAVMAVGRVGHVDANIQYRHHQQRATRRDLGLLLQISLVLVAAGVTRVALGDSKSRHPPHPASRRSKHNLQAYRLLGLPTGSFRCAALATCNCDSAPLKSSTRNPDLDGRRPGALSSSRLYAVHTRSA